MVQMIAFSVGVMFGVMLVEIRVERMYGEFESIWSSVRRVREAFVMELSIGCRNYQR